MITKEAAKAAAQADYEARILSAITPAPDLASENERLRAALKSAGKALLPMAEAVFNDNGDITVQMPTPTYDECVSAYFAEKRINAELERT